MAKPNLVALQENGRSQAQFVDLVQLAGRKPRLEKELAGPTMVFIRTVGDSKQIPVKLPSQQKPK